MFWELVDESRHRAKGHSVIQIALLKEMLEGLPPEEIVAFGHRFDELHARAYTWDLWGAAYLVGGGCSDDGFADFRGWLISQGEEVYESALANPESLAPVAERYKCKCQVEGFQYVSMEAWTKKAGRGFAEFPRDQRNYQRIPMGEEWEEDDLSQRFPSLCKLAIQFGHWSAE
jgi:hypothetical protein